MSYFFRFCVFLDKVRFAEVWMFNQSFMMPSSAFLITVIFSFISVKFYFAYS